MIPTLFRGKGLREGHTAHKQERQDSHSDLRHAYMLAGHTKPSSLEKPGSLNRERMLQGGMSYNTGEWQREDALPHTDPAEAVRGRQRCENCPGQGRNLALLHPGCLALSLKTTGFFLGDLGTLRPQEAEHTQELSQL